MRLPAGLNLALAALTFESLTPVAHAQQTRTAGDGVYSEAQAARGHALYRDTCAKCHGDALEGNRKSKPKQEAGQVGAADEAMPGEGAPKEIEEPIDSGEPISETEPRAEKDKYGTKS